MLSLITLCGCVNLKTLRKANTKIPDSYLSGIWVSYIEVNSFLKDGNFKDNFKNVIKVCKENKISDMFVCVRAFCDSLYKSKYFPQNEFSSGCDFDVTEYMISLCHKNGIKFHAWINPYRVRTEDNDITKLPKESPYLKLLSEKDIGVTESGIYLIPSSERVKKLVSEGVREILNLYSVDGIHIDDYFYPAVTEDFDKTLYGEYKENCQNPLDIKDYRTNNVTALVSSIYSAVKFKNKDIVFSISPCASAEKNINSYYADIESFCKSGCVDIVIPQLYFGFDYPDKNFCFDKLLNDWKNLTKGTNVKLLIGLATYKINTALPPDNTEWQNGNEIIKRQEKICENERSVNGVVYFSYTSFCEYAKAKQTNQTKKDGTQN